MCALTFGYKIPHPQAQLKHKSAKSNPMNEEPTEQEIKDTEEAFRQFLNQPARTESEMYESAKIRAIQEIQDNPNYSEE
jgi:hypothetical protein